MSQFKNKKANTNQQSPGWAMGVEAQARRAKMSLYEAIDVWKRVSTRELVRYRCFRNLATNRYSVQSADFYRLPLDPTQAGNIEKQFYELLAEQTPDERADSFQSLEEAIAAHEREFAS
ncbi:MAG TPA: hypothetical protein VKY85_20300 [Candidatus Angelobacter sp.]|nr:hypothetical protein [Candidatus Angelobacter sp.]